MTTPTDTPRPAAIVTGSRADFGLLAPVIRAAQRHPGLEPLVVAAGSHLVQPALTFRDVKKLFPVADSVPMQTVGKTGRFRDAEALGKGAARFARSFERLAPHWVVVLGDRIEALAAAAAASVAGLAVCHIHGGDRAEGVADEAMRHAVTKLAHLHCAATEQSAERIRRMGERPQHVHTTGSPAIDGLDDIPPLGDDAVDGLTGGRGLPAALVVLHPIGDPPELEEARAAELLARLDTHLNTRLDADTRAHAAGPGEPTPLLALAPNLDPGRDGIARAIANAGTPTREHLPRPAFVGLLKRLAAAGRPLVGNSSAGLIEAPALGVPVVDLGPRQAGRERPASVAHADTPAAVPAAIADAIRLARTPTRTPAPHPYGDGRAGERIAHLLATTDPRDPALLRKHNTY